MLLPWPAKRRTRPLERERGIRRNRAKMNFGEFFKGANGEKLSAYKCRLPRVQSGGANEMRPSCYAMVGRDSRTAGARKLFVAFRFERPPRSAGPICDCALGRTSAP